MMQVKSPRCIGSQRSSNTVVVPPPAAGKRVAMPSMEMNLFAIAQGSLRALFTLPWRGRVDWPKANRGGVNGEDERSPPPGAPRPPDPPPPGGGERAGGRARL